MSAFTMCTQHSTEISSIAGRQGKEIKSTQIRKEEVKSPLFADGTIFKIPQKKKLLELMNEFRKVAGHKVNLQKSDAFLYNYSE